MAELPKKVQIGWQVFRRREATSEYITRSGMCIDLFGSTLCARRAAHRLQPRSLKPVGVEKFSHGVASRTVARGPT